MKIKGENKMIDLHMHTKYSDGTDECINILKKAEEKKLNYISITDHNTCNAYSELKEICINKYYSGKIICGVELNTKVQGIPIEILGYNVNPDIVNELTKKIYLTAQDRNLLEVKRLYEKCIKNNIILPEDFIEKYNSEIYASKYLHNTITKNIENKKIIDEDAWCNSNIFYRKYMSNPKTIFYVDTDDILPDFYQASSIIKEAGGLVFIPHIFEYRDNAIKILKYILENYTIDGIECFYTTFTKENSEYLLKICKENKFLISGGSDYHGTFKPDVDMGIGKGDLKVEEKYAIDWIQKSIWNN